MAPALADPNVRPHDHFFFSDGSLYLLVENSLYCVHKYLFEIHATIFPVRELETSVTKPHVLEDVKKIDLDRLLANLYPRTLGVEETETTQDWISVLGLASKWGFKSLRSKAISKIEQTLDSPIDMVTLGRQYGIPDVLLPGYAVLCQSTVPLSYEEGLRLGVEDVVNIYRIRHELYGFGITPLPLEVAFSKVKEAGLGDERPRQELEGEQARTDVGSVAALQTSTEKDERGAITLTPDVDSSRLDVADAATLVSERPKQRHADGHSPSDEPTLVAFGNGGSNAPSSVLPANVSDLNSESSESARKGLNFVEELTYNNFDLVFVEIMQWVNTKDIQTLHQITRFITEKAIEAPLQESSSCVCLSRAMVKYPQTRRQITRLMVEKAIEEPRRSGACAQPCGMMMTGAYGNPTMTADGLLFSKYLGEICQENLEAIAASVAGAGEHLARIRRLHLIEFIGALLNNNFDQVSVEIVQWLNTKDIHMLYPITRLIVEKAIKAPKNPTPYGRHSFAQDPFTPDPFVRLCKEMVKHTQPLRQITKLIVEKAMEEPRLIGECANLCSTTIMKSTKRNAKATITADGLLFSKCLGEICQENLEAVTALVAGAGDHTARVRRLRLIELIRQLWDVWTPDIIEKWMTALLDANDEEKVATLCMLMTRLGTLRTSPDEEGWFKRVTIVTEETSKPRVRQLLKEVTKGSRVNWVLPSEDCTVQ